MAPHTHMHPQSLKVEKVGRRHNEGQLGYFDNSIVKLSLDGEILFENKNKNNNRK